MIKVKLNFLIIAVLINILFVATINAQAPNLDHSNTQPVRMINKEDSVKTSSKSPTGAMIRSLIFPGWGQLYNKKYFKAILAFGAEIGLLTNSIYLNQKYKASDTELEREFYINNRNLSNWWLVGVILFSMADAFVDAHLSDFDESPDLTYLKISPIGTGYNIGVQLSVYFNFHRPWTLRDGFVSNLNSSRWSWGSMIGFIVPAVGSAIGPGNIWQFFYVLI